MTVRDEAQEGDEMGAIGRRLRRRGRPGTLRTSSAADVEHLETFVRTRQGVEAFVEPRTTVTETTVVLVAHDGEWTRRRVDGERGANAFARRAGIPVYDVTTVGYPRRMREWDARRRDSGR